MKGSVFMQKVNDNFFSIVLKVMELEAKYGEKHEGLNHLLCLLNKYGKDNSNKITIAKYECESTKKEIDELVKEVSGFKLDELMQAYYDLYKENSELLKKFWEHETEIGYLDSRSIFDCICDRKIEMENEKRRSELINQRKLVTARMEEIVSDMSTIYIS
jgi:hypothetical protein